jgi:uncharacterized protein with FMN-binding domain
MRRITLWMLSTVAVVVLLFSYRTSLNSAPASASVADPVIRPVDPAPATSPAPSASASPAPSQTSTGTKTYDGSVAQTLWGPVQVSITVADGKITDVAVPTYPNGNGRDAEINAYALPILVRETLSAQNAGIDTVSGATVTSDGYLESLQAALDAAHLR